MTQRILLNHVYYSPAGHVVDALRHAKGLYDANPGSEIHLALIDSSPWELCTGAPWVTATYRVKLRERAYGGMVVPELPREWHYVMDNNLMYREVHGFDQPGRPARYVPPVLGWEEKAVLAYYEHSEAELVVRCGRGVLFPEITTPAGLGYRPDTHVRLQVPAASRAFATRYEHRGQRICILPAGSGAARQYPEADTWIAVIRALRTRFPAARFYLTGARATTRYQTTTTCNDADVARILGADDQIVDCFDIGLWNQVALLEQCDVLISPHSGFAFLALCVATPWLTISGGNWPEYFFNDVPFYSLLPDNPDYPYLGTIDGDQDGPTIVDMRPEKLLPRIPELLDAAAFLFDPATTYQDALRRHRRNVARASVRRDFIPTA